jgi:hypothetical protein
MANLRAKESHLLLVFLFIAFAIGCIIILYIVQTIIIIIHDFII